MSKKPYPGSQCYKVDFHIHTPQSRDYHDNTTAKDIVNAAIAAGLDAIAITDHNDYRYIDDVKKAAAETSLVVFPGVELSTRDGHLLAIFDPQKSGTDVKTALITCGLRDEQKYGEQETASLQTIEEAAQNVIECGGISIAAHVAQKRIF